MKIQASGRTMLKVKVKKQNWIVIYKKYWRFEVGDRTTTIL